jgi:hypothetical protein
VVIFVLPIIHHCDLSGDYPLHYFPDFDPAISSDAIASYFAPRQQRLKLLEG